MEAYKAGKTLKSRVQNRKGHIAELVRSLRGYEAALEGYVEWVLKGAEIEFDQLDDVEKVNAVLADPAVVDDVRDFLGKTAANALVETLESCVLALSEISCSINDFLPTPNPATDPHVNVQYIAGRYAASKEIALWKGIKLAFSKSELDAQILRIDRCTGLLDKLQSTRTAIGQLEGNEPTRRSKHIVRALNKIGHHAERLHKALKAGWAPGCHESHEVKLFLEDRLVGARSKPKRQEVQFRLIFSGGGHQGNLIWHDSHVQVLEDEDEDQQSSVIGTGKVPKVAIIAPQKSSKNITRRQLHNICLCIMEAQKSQIHLELYLLSHSVIHYSHSSAMIAKSGSKGSTVSLEDLIITASKARPRSHRLPLMSRLNLALVLASKTLQLGFTSWLKQPWSKDTVCFINNHTSVGGVPNIPRIELSEPVLCEQFSDADTASSISTGARVVLLELGIILLELWNEMTIEQHYEEVNIVVKKDYFNRLSLAQQWLEDSQLDILPAYYDAVARLVKCHFDGIPVNPSWDDQNLRSGLVKTVIEPLQRQCKVDA